MSGAPPPAVALSMHATPLHPLPEHWLPWKQRAIGWGVTPGDHLDVIREEKVPSTVDWPVGITDSTISAGGRVVEARLTALYFMLEWCGSPSCAARPPSWSARGGTRSPSSSARGPLERSGGAGADDLRALHPRRAVNASMTLGMLGLLAVHLLRVNEAHHHARERQDQ